MLSKKFAIPALLLAITLAPAVDPPAPGIMGTLAGTGKVGYSGDGGPATKALLKQPFHCEADGKGHLYVAEAENHCIRKVDLKTGVITTVAGTGKKGYSGDGGKATNASFFEPYAVVVDANDNLYIVDRLNAVIRKVDGQSGIVSTIAGNGKKMFAGDNGPGKEASLREPNDCCFDGKGGLLIADVGDWRIRRLDLKTGIITTFAGIGRPTGAAKGFDREKIGDGGPATKAVLVGARAICVDGKGNTFVCEREGSSIRKIDSDGIIATISGDGSWGYAGDIGPARKATFKGPKGIRCDKEGNLYIVDTENHAIRKIDVRCHLITTIAGGQKGKEGDGGPATQAGLDRPHGAIVDAHGILYIADSNNERVRWVKLK